MSLRKRQSEFAYAIGKLINFIYECGDEVTFGDTYPGKFKHSPTGKHPKGLAVDLNLFINGIYQESTEAHAKYGAYWKGLGGIWGGDFKNKDGNHYEFPE